MIFMHPQEVCPDKALHGARVPILEIRRQWPLGDGAGTALVVPRPGAQEPTSSLRPAGLPLLSVPSLAGSLASSPTPETWPQAKHRPWPAPCLCCVLHLSSSGKGSSSASHPSTSLHLRPQVQTTGISLLTTVLASLSPLITLNPKCESLV